MIFFKLCCISLVIVLASLLVKGVITDRRKDYYTEYDGSYAKEAYNVADKAMTVAFLVFVASIILAILFASFEGVCGS